MFGRDSSDREAELQEHKPWQKPLSVTLPHLQKTTSGDYGCNFIFQELRGSGGPGGCSAGPAAQRCHGLENPSLHFQVHSGPDAKALGLFLQT